MSTRYLVQPAVLGKQSHIEISAKKYQTLVWYNMFNFKTFEVELAFEFVVMNYIDIEKYIAEHFVRDMVVRDQSEDTFRAWQWGFMRVLSNWLSSIRFWHDLLFEYLDSQFDSERRFFNHCKEFDRKLRAAEIEYDLVFHLRNYSQHKGFPLSSSARDFRWNDDRTQSTISSTYSLDYEAVRSYFEAPDRDDKRRIAFGKRLQAYSGGSPLDLKSVIRKSMGLFGRFMDEFRVQTSNESLRCEEFVLDLIKKFTTVHPGSSILGLAAFPVDEKGLKPKKSETVSVRDEFIIRLRNLRKQNTESSLSTEKRAISNR